MDPDPVISVVVPVFNEEENLDELVVRTTAACQAMKRDYEIILVDDGSSDHSRDRITSAAERHAGRVIGVFLNRNYGRHSAIMAGFAEASGDVIVTLDADLQDPPEEIPRLLEKIEQGSDVVGAVRPARRGGVARRLISGLINRAVRRMTGVMMHDYDCTLRAYRRRIVVAMLGCHERTTYIPVLANMFARTASEIEVAHAGRSAGRSRRGAWKSLNLLVDLLTATTTFPLRLLTIMGVLMTVTGAGVGAVLLGLRLARGPDWAVHWTFPLLAAALLFVGGQFLGLGCIGEYIGRIYADVRARPRFFVDRVVGRPVDETE